MKQTITKILIIFASLVLALIICEVGLRLFGIGYPDFFDYDPYVGSKLRPGITGYFLKEGATSASTRMACGTGSTPSNTRRIP
jgi:hypothetical protein